MEHNKVPLSLPGLCHTGPTILAHLTLAKCIMSTTLTWTIFKYAAPFNLYGIDYAIMSKFEVNRIYVDRNSTSYVRNTRNLKL
jgi:hypothetical protein